MARRKANEEEYEDEYEEEYAEETIVESISTASWRRMILVPLILVLFGFGSWMLWKKYSEEVLNHSSYILDASNISYTSEPEWLGNRNIGEEVIELGSLESKKIHEPGLSVGIGSAFMLHPWVKEVDRVRLHYPAKIEVVLTYRKPVAFVVMPVDIYDDGKARIMPIDSEAVVLPPEDFTPELAQAFPRIDVGDTQPIGRDFGTGWGDPVVADAAKIAELLVEDWGELKDVLYQIQLNPRPTSTSAHADFDILGRPGAGPNGGTLVFHWGRAPGDEQSDEPPAQTKYKALKQWVEDARTNELPLDGIDLRSIRNLQAAKSRLYR